MSLNKQMILFITSLLMILLVGTFILNLNNTKTFLQEQLHSHAQDTATSLGLSLSSIQDPSDYSSMETMINAVFDRGYYESIRLTDTNDQVIYQRVNTKTMDDVPDFFIQAINLSAPPATALVQSGWIPIGTLTVTSHTGYAYIELWNTVLNLLTWFALTALIAIIIIIAALKVMLAPLKKLVNQAQAITQKQYLIQDKLPKTCEFQEVVCAMNTMVQKLKTIFERDAKTAEKLQKMAYQDTVTGLHNRRHFEMLLDSLLDPTNDAEPGIICLLHIHKLKTINEHYGYIAGDKLVTQFAELMQTHLHHHNSLFARLNGTELIAVLPGCTPEQIQAQAEKITQDVPRLLTSIATPPPETSISIAYIHYEPGQSRSTLLAHLDFAMNQAKQLGNNQIYFYKTDTNTLIFNSAWDKKLDQAFFEERFLLYQQSSYNKNREVHDQEILIRFSDFDGIIRSAGYFMPAIAQLNRIEEIDKFVIQSVLQVLHSNTQAPAVAINLSKSILENTAFKNWFIKTLKAHSEIFSKLSFELTERLIQEEKGSAWPLINELKHLNIGVGIDHFGSGFSQIHDLQTLQPDYIKLDPSFSKTIIDDEKTQNYIASLYELSTSLDIRIIATSIETKEQQKAFAQLGIEYFQGYYYGAPTPLTPNNT